MPGASDTTEIVSDVVQRMVRVRWVGIVVAALQMAIFDSSGMRPGVLAGMYALLVGLSVVNLAVARLPEEHTDNPRVAAVTIAADTVVLVAFVLALAFQPATSTYVLLVLVPIEGALHFGLRGAWWGGAVALAGVVARELAETAYGDVVELDAITFRAGVIGVVALAVAWAVADRDTARLRTQDALVAARAADERRRRLVTALAHDVRSPLAGARTSLTSLRDLATSITPDEAVAVAEAGIRQADRGLVLARDLLDMAALDHGRLSVTTGPVDLAELVTGVARLANAEVATDVQPGLVVEADGPRLEQALLNLVSNAVQHGSPPVSVRGRHVDGSVEVTVRDHGAGVPEGLAIFDAFASGGSSGSTGLGLWLVRELVTAQGGRVRYEPAEPGSRFVVSVPVAGRSSTGAS